jgi:DNA helicase INO80
MSTKPLKRSKGKQRAPTGQSNATKPTLEDELLGLVEGEDSQGGPGPSSPPPFSDDEDDDNDNESLNAERFDPDTIVQPSGLTRAEIIAKVTNKDMTGLTETDVKAVQDEMWLREKNGLAPTNKDGTVRRKPGPAKGWKKLRGGLGQDWDERSEGTSVGDITLNGEADADIAALLDDDISDTGSRKRKSRPSIKKRRFEEEGVGGEGGSEFDSEDDRSGAPAGSRNGRIKEPGVGKGKWTRPTKSAAGEDDFGDQEPEAQDPGPGPVSEAIPTGPNAVDPRGVSETEAKVRLTMVEDLEKVAWASICRDIPRVSVVFLPDANKD